MENWQLQKKDCNFISMCAGICYLQCIAECRFVVSVHIYVLHSIVSINKIQTIPIESMPSL